MADRRHARAREAKHAGFRADRTGSATRPSELDGQRIEALLGLPDGAARRRRLFVVRVRSEGVEGTAVRRDDRLVVEPGGRKSVGALVLCKGARSVEVLCVRQAPNGRVFLRHPSPEWLPLLPAGADSVLGTVIAVVRRFDARWRAVRWQLAGLPSQPCSPTRCPDTGGAVESREQRLANLDRTILAIETRSQALSRWSPRRARALDNAATQLRALRHCLAAVTEPRLSAALLSEIDTTIARARRQTHADAGSAPRREAPNQLDFLRVGS